MSSFGHSFETKIIWIYIPSSVINKFFIYIYNGAAVYQWCEFKKNRGKNKNLTAQKSNSNTVGLIFRRIFNI
jgi:hypothetical protein